MKENHARPRHENAKSEDDNEKLQKGKVASVHDEVTSSVGQKLRETGEAVRTTDVVEKAGSALADVSEQLESTNFEKLKSSARKIVRDYPMASLGSGMGVGVLMGIGIRGVYVRAVTPNAMPVAPPMEATSGTFVFSSMHAKSDLA